MVQGRTVAGDYPVGIFFSGFEYAPLSCNGTNVRTLATNIGMLCSMYVHMYTYL